MMQKQTKKRESGDLDGFHVGRDAAEIHHASLLLLLPKRVRQRSRPGGEGRRDA
jgi:hypothetical protein